MRPRGGSSADRSRPWFLPGSVTLAFVGLGAAAIWADRRLLSGGDSSYGFDGGADAASTLLSTIAGSIITVAGLAFSLTIVTIQLVSSQFTPRAVGTFLKDRFNQISVGCFAGVFAYCVVVLRSIRAPDEAGGGFIPGLSVNLGILLGLGAVQLLVIFIFRVGRSIDVGDIATRLGRSTQRELQRCYPDPFTAGATSGGGELVAAWRDFGAAQIVRSGQSGYVEQIRWEALTELLRANAQRVHLIVCPGDFVTVRTALAELWSNEQLPAETLEQLAGCVAITSQRTLRQDPEFGVRQLTDIALRAISPGVNDPTTAVMCIGYLRNLLEQLAARADLPGLVEAEPVTLVARRRTFVEYLQSSVVELSRYAASDARVAGALLEALAGVAGAAMAAGASSRLEAIAEAIEAVSAPALESARTDLDRALLGVQLTAARRAVRAESEITAPTAR